MLIFLKIKNMRYMRESISKKSSEVKNWSVTSQLLDKNSKKQPPSEHIHIIVELSTTTGKCLLMVYLLNKKFVDLLLIFLFFSFHFLPTSIKSTYKRKGNFDIEILRKQILFKIRVMRFGR